MTERRLTERGRERRRQLMDFATVQFAERGYDPTSVADIVDGVGVGKGVFYWYFESKEELLIQILDEAQLDLARTQQQSTDTTTDPVLRIELAIRATIAWQASHRSVATIRHFAAGEARFADAMRRNHEAAVAHWVRLVVAGIEQEEIRADHPTMLANAIIGVMINFDRVFVKRGTDPEVVGDAAVRFCLDGMRTREQDCGAGQSFVRARRRLRTA